MLIRCSALSEVGRLGGEGGITMGQGAEGVSNLLMEAVAGRNEYDKQTFLGMQTTRVCVQLKTKTETKRGRAGHQLRRNVLERT